MIWYKVIIRHGPGHQRETTWYRYVPTKEWIEDEIERSHMSWPIAMIRKVKTIPKAVQAELIKDEKSKIKWSREKIASLKGIPTR